MITLKLQIGLTCLLALATVTPATAEEKGAWMTDLASAKETATKEKKDLLILFTGSDWCGWCRKLEQEKLSETTFLREAGTQFQLVKIDFPRGHNLPPAITEQNASLKESYRVITYPSVFLCDSQGRPYARTGYRKGDAAAYIDHLKSLQKKKTLRDRMFKLASTQTGEQKARTLESALNSVPRSALTHYADVIKTIQDADPSDASGFFARYQVQKTAIDLGYEIRPLLREGNPDRIASAVEKYITTHALKDEALQTALTFTLSAQYSAKQYQAALKTADKIIAINEVSTPGRYSTMLKKRLLRKMNASPDPQ